MDIETYGGECPYCTKGLYQKHTNSSHGLSFEVCLWCGFGIGQYDHNCIKDSITNSKKIWEIIIEHHLNEELSESHFKHHLMRIRKKLDINESTKKDDIYHPTLFMVNYHQSKYHPFPELLAMKNCNCSGFQLLHHGHKCGLF